MNVSVVKDMIVVVESIGLGYIPGASEDDANTDKEELLEIIDEPTEVAVLATKMLIRRGVLDVLPADVVDVIEAVDVTDV